MSKLSRGETLTITDPSQVWRAIDLLIEELGWRGRCVEFTVGGDVHCYEWVEKWLRESIDQGHKSIRYVVDSGIDSLIRVDFAAAL